MFTDIPYFVTVIIGNEILFCNTASKTDSLEFSELNENGDVFSNADVLPKQRNNEDVSLFVVFILLLFFSYTRSFLE